MSQKEIESEMEKMRKSGRDVLEGNVLPGPTASTARRKIIK